MNEEDIKKVISIMLTADGGCDFCAKALLEQLETAFPQFRDIIHATFPDSVWEEV